MSKRLEKIDGLSSAPRTPGVNGIRLPGAHAPGFTLSRALAR